MNYESFIDKVLNKFRNYIYGAMIEKYFVLQLNSKLVDAQNVLVTVKLNYSTAIY